MNRPAPGGSGRGPLYVRGRDLGRTMRVTAVEWVTSMVIGCAAPIMSMVQLCVLPALVIGQNLGRFPFDVLNENHRHCLDCGVVGPPKKHY